MLSAALEDQLDPPPGETLGNIASRHRVLARLHAGQASATREDEWQDQLFVEVRSQRVLECHGWPVTIGLPSLPVRIRSEAWSIIVADVGWIADGLSWLA